MSDVVHTARRTPIFAERKSIEARLMFGACYLLFLCRAIATRLMPWRAQPTFGRPGERESIFREASCAAGVLVSSSFMGL